MCVPHSYFLSLNLYIEILHLQNDRVKNVLFGDENIIRKHYYLLLLYFF